MDRKVKNPLDTTISSPSFIELTKRSIKENEQKVDKLFSDLNDYVEQLTLLDDHSPNKISLIEKCEYVIFQLRVKLSWEQTKLKDISSVDVYPQVAALFKKREVAVTSLLQRLNELREDVTIIQKILWIKNNKNLF